MTAIRQKEQAAQTPMMAFNVDANKIMWTFHKTEYEGLVDNAKNVSAYEKSS